MRNNFWRLIIVIVVLLICFSWIYPPTSSDLITKFQERAVKTDTNFVTIVEHARGMQKAMPEKSFDNLRDAIGTNDITRYFPFYGAATNASNPTRYILTQLQREAAGKIKLGIDLQGGTSFLVRMSTNELVEQADIGTNAPGATTNHLARSIDTGAAINQAIEVLRKRVDEFGVAEPLIQQQGADHILILLPGLSTSSQEEAIEKIKKPAYLEFRMVHPDSEQDVKENNIHPGYEVLRSKEKQRDGQQVEVLVEVRKKPEMVGGIKASRMDRTQLGEPEILFELDSAGSKRFGELTTENTGQRMAIVLDGVLYSYPRINEPIRNGSGRITGQFDETTAHELVAVLENPLKTPLILEASQQVSPTLGTDAIHSGIKAALYGTIAVSVFMIVYYMIAGLVANIALIVNIIILVGVMCFIGTTFTLPGIAGIVLTVGMAVDANVLIYERIREESAKGKSLRGAIAAGYSRAFGTIFDSHVTTLISSLILAKLGTGSIKGFGVALTIGVAASLFTALVVTRLIFDFLLARGWLKEVKMLHIIRASNLDFMKIALPAFIISWALIVVGMGAGIHRGKSAWGRDFVGGASTTFDYKEQVKIDDVRKALETAGVKDTLIQNQRNLSTARETLRVDSKNEDAQTVKKVVSEYGGGKLTFLGQDSVGAVVGETIRNSAIIASILSLFGILVYVAFRYEFSFAVGAVVAVLHDVLMTIGWYFLSGRQFNATTVAAVLTIIGFSINDTIVIFDRIREDLKLGVRGTFREVMNQALNQTLSRTIITSGTVFLATLMLFIFGGGEINDFAFTFLVGIITGTYSSIYIASFLVLKWHGGNRPNIGAGQIVVENTPQPREKAA